MRSAFMHVSVVIGLFCGNVGPRPCVAGEGRLTPPAPPGGVTTSLEDCELLTPGFDFTWETNATVLRDKLLVSPLPTGVAITGVTLTPNPNDIGENESVGYYESFLLEDGPYSLTIANGIVLSTGDFVNQDEQHAEYCNDLDDFSGGDDENNTDPGDVGIVGMYSGVTCSSSSCVRTDDAVSLTLTFTSDGSIAGLVFDLIMGSDEFPYYTAPMPTPADPGQQADALPPSSRADTFGAFLDGLPFANIKDEQGNDVLINVAKDVIKYNNNWSGTEDHRLTNCCAGGGSLDAGDYTNVLFNIEYHYCPAKQV